MCSRRNNYRLTSSILELAHEITAVRAAGATITDSDAEALEGCLYKLAAMAQALEERMPAMPRTLPPGVVDLSAVRGRTLRVVPINAGPAPGPLAG
ncbi:hypothetical protein ACM64Y_00470 [Novispirillum sp. DQ9]|uniref:hypothetical protein n=1 Tax=Novispirillum sp. DQ9 TaxID=3398612 RepID=UPI003C79E2E1